MGGGTRSHRPPTTGRTVDGMHPLDQLVEFVEHLLPRPRHVVRWIDNVLRLDGSVGVGKQHAPPSSVPAAVLIAACPKTGTSCDGWPEPTSQCPSELTACQRHYSYSSAMPFRIASCDVATVGDAVAVSIAAHCEHVRRARLASRVIVAQ